MKARAISAFLLTLLPFALYGVSAPSIERNGSQWAIRMPTQPGKGYELLQTSSLSSSWSPGNPQRGTGSMLEESLDPDGDTVFIRYRVFDVWTAAHITPQDQGAIDLAFAATNPTGNTTFTVTGTDTGTWSSSETQIDEGMTFTVTLSGTWTYAADATDLNNYDMPLTITTISIYSHYHNMTLNYTPVRLAQESGVPQVTWIEYTGTMTGEEQLSYEGAYHYTDGSTEPFSGQIEE
jgi:hypothetical protein